MKIAVCLFDIAGTNSIVARAHIKEFMDNYPEYTVDVFEDFSTDSAIENLARAKWQKRLREIANRRQYDVNIGVLAAASNRIGAIKNLGVAEQTLYYTDGLSENWKTVVHPRCFYGKSLVFDRVAEFAYWRPHKNLILPENKKFYWYIKTWKITTVCVDMENFKII